MEFLELGFMGVLAVYRLPRLMVVDKECKANLSTEDMHRQGGKTTRDYCKYDTEYAPNHRMYRDAWCFGS